MFLHKEHLQTAFAELRKSHRYIYVLFEHLPANYFSIVCSFDYRSVKEGDGAQSQPQPQPQPQPQSQPQPQPQPTRIYTLPEFFAALPQIDELDELQVKILGRTLTDDTELTIPHLDECYKNCLYRLCAKWQFEGRLLELTPQLIRDYGLGVNDVGTVRDLLVQYNHIAAEIRKVDILKSGPQNQQGDTGWERVEQVIRETHHTMNTFAKYIGLRHTENLYRIKRGQNGVSRTLASRIHDFYPDYSILWIMTGVDETNKMTGRVVRLPLYRDYTTMKLSPEGPPSEYLTLSASVASDAEFAVSYSDNIVNPYLLNATLLMKTHREPDLILYGNIYLVEVQGRRLFRIVNEHTPNPDMVCLTTLQPSTVTLIIVPKSQITGLWLAVGAVSKLCR